MNKRPRSVTVISWLFVVFGCISLLRSLLPSIDGAVDQRTTEFMSLHPFQYARNYIGPVLSVVCGVFMLRGCNWGRWILLVWCGNNSIGGLWHSPMYFLLPCLLFGTAFYFLFRPQAKAYFRGTIAEPPQIPKTDETPA